MPADLDAPLTAINEATTPACAVCPRPLSDGPSDDFCSPACQHVWHQARADARAVEDLQRPDPFGYTDGNTYCDDEDCEVCTPPRRPVPARIRRLEGCDCAVCAAALHGEAPPLVNPAGCSHPSAGRIVEAIGSYLTNPTGPPVYLGDGSVTFTLQCEDRATPILQRLADQLRRMCGRQT